MLWRSSADGSGHSLKLKARSSSFVAAESFDAPFRFAFLPLARTGAEVLAGSSSSAAAATSERKARESLDAYLQIGVGGVLSAYAEIAENGSACIARVKERAPLRDAGQRRDAVFLQLASPAALAERSRRCAYVRAYVLCTQP